MKQYTSGLKSKLSLFLVLLVFLAGCNNSSTQNTATAALSPSQEPTISTTPSPSSSDVGISNNGSTTDTTTVYVTESGSKYHADGCQYLSHSKIAISLENAISKGYGPCSKCNPPTLSGSANSSVSVSTPEPTPTIAETQPQTIETTVYVTNTGSKYHSAGCQYLSKSQIAISPSDAKAQGYGACSKCNPPS